MARIVVKVENQLFRYIPSLNIEGDRLIEELGAVRSGDYIIRQMKDPPVTLIVDSENGIIVHGTSRDEVARAACRELLLSLGEPEGGLKTERGPITASFDFDKKIDLARAAEAFSAVTFDARLDAIRISDGRHDVELLVFRDGRAIIMQALSSSIAERAAKYWDERFERGRLFEV